MRTEGFNTKPSTCFADVKVGEAVLWKGCIFVKAQPYDSNNKANSICVRNDKTPNPVPYLAYIGNHENVEVVKGCVHFD